MACPSTVADVVKSAEYTEDITMTRSTHYGVCITSVTCSLCGTLITRGYTYRLVTDYCIRCYHLQVVAAKADPSAPAQLWPRLSSGGSVISRVGSKIGGR